MRKSHMDGTEYRDALAALGLSVRAGAKWMQCDLTTAQRQANNHRPVSWDTATLLRLMVRLKLKPEHLAKIVPEAYNATHGGEKHPVGQIPKRKARG